MAVICPKCKNQIKPVTGAILFPHLPNIHNKYFYDCAPCGMRVGCHPDTKIPLGIMADKELRRMRLAAHNAFDRLWKESYLSRTEAYELLSAYLGIKRADTHIGCMDKLYCQQVIKFSNTELKNFKLKRVTTPSESNYDYLFKKTDK